ncbi:MAG: glycine cleavage system protein GcvH [Alphaproteobacteria bacterium]|nr:glycine cleavage system protein GcvH [Alphaproteobacteria bacterium]MDE2336920.1 glycine cleavage system protein GcvH [Alphaproteobacteria bacterium]
MSKTLFSDDHEYVKIEGDTGTVGITDYAQNALGDVVYVELPKVGAKIAKGEQAGVVESVKSASEVYAPVSGEVVAVNDALAGDPAAVNQDPLGKGWFYKVKIGNQNELVALKDEAAYADYTKDL